MLKNLIISFFILITSIFSTYSIAEIDKAYIFYNNDEKVAESIYGIIYYKDIKNEYERLINSHINQFNSKSRDDTLTIEQAKKYIITSTEKLILNRVLDKEIKKNKINISQKSIDASIGQLKKVLKGDAYTKYVENQGGIEKVKAKTLKKMQQTELFLFWDKQEPSLKEQEVKEFYNNNIEKFKHEKKIRFSVIWIKHPENAPEAFKDSNLKLIKKLRASILKKEKSFEEIAKNFSDDNKTKKTGGDYGFIPVSKLGDYYSPFLELKKDELSPVYISPKGFYIAKITDTKPEGIYPFEKIRSSLRKKLLTKKLLEARNEKLKKFYEEAKIIFFTK